MRKSMYSKDGYSILCSCLTCGRLNYVEQHGTTADCKCGVDRKHVSLPYEYRDFLGTHYNGPARLYPNA